MRKMSNTKPDCRCLRREEWSPPLPDGAPRPMSYWVLGWRYLPGLAHLINFAQYTKFVRLVVLPRLAFSSLLMSGKRCAFGLGIAAGCGSVGGRLLNAVAH